MGNRANWRNDEIDIFHDHGGINERIRAAVKLRTQSVPRKHHREIFGSSDSSIFLQADEAKPLQPAKGIETAARE